MGMLAMTLGLLVTAAGPAPPAGAAAGYRPTGSAVDLHDLSRLALLRDPAVRPVIVRSGRSEDPGPGPRTLARIEGPGVIQRLWIGGSGAAELQIRLDGSDEPALTLSLDDLFGGRHPRFPAPLVGRGDSDWGGGRWCYVPIAFRERCELVVDPYRGEPFEVDAARLPSDEGLVPFDRADSPEERAHRARAVALWSRPEAFPPGEEDAPITAVYPVEALGAASQEFALPDGPRTVRLLEVIPAPETADAWASARLRLTWEADDPARAGVDLPLAPGFGRVRWTESYHSVLAGHEERGRWSLRLPMPYRRQARLRIDAEAPIRGTVRVVATPGVAPGSGYLRTSGPPPLGAIRRIDSGPGLYVGAVWAGFGDAPLTPLPWTDTGSPKLARDGGLLLWSDFGSEGPDLAARRARTADRLLPLFGMAELPTERPVVVTFAYRWHLADPIPFSCGLDVAEFDGREFTRSHALVFWYSPRPGPETAGAR